MRFELMILLNWIILLNRFHFSSNQLIPNQKTIKTCDNSDSINYSGKCNKFSKQCRSWIASITLVLNPDTNPIELRNIKDKLVETYSMCGNSNIDVTIFVHGVLIERCTDIQTCNTMINKLTMDQINDNANNTQTWEHLLAFYERRIGGSEGFVAYVITNYECNNWSTSSTILQLINYRSLFAADSFKCVVIVKFIQLFNEAANSFCDLNDMVYNSYNLIDFVSTSSLKLKQLDTSLISMCESEDSKYTLQDWPKRTNCSKGKLRFITLKDL